MAVIKISAPALQKQAVSKEVLEEYQGKEFPLKVTFTNKLPLRLVIPQIKLFLNHVCAKDGQSASVTVESLDELQRAVSDIAQLAALNHAKAEAVEFEESPETDDPTKSIFAAILKDKKGSVTQIITGETCTAKLAGDNKVKVTLTGTELKKHTNGEDKEGNWIGVAFVAPEGVNQVKYNTQYAMPLESNVHEQKAGFALYWDNAKTQKLKFTIQWFKDGYPVGAPLTVEADSTGVTNAAAEAAAIRAEATKSVAKPATTAATRKTTTKKAG